jgi:hypothetical protein
MMMPHLSAMASGNNCRVQVTPPVRLPDQECSPRSFWVGAADVGDESGTSGRGSADPRRSPLPQSIFAAVRRRLGGPRHSEPIGG